MKNKPLEIKIPDIHVVVTYGCPICKISGIKRKNDCCPKCGTVFYWSPYKHSVSTGYKTALKIKRHLVNGEWDQLNLDDAGKAKYYNSLKLSVVTDDVKIIKDE